MSDDYQSHLDQLHAGMRAPEDVVRTAIRSVSAAETLFRRRIVEGEANEVQEFRLADGLHLILRIARDPRRGFAGERWAIDACRAAGVPAPEMLSVGQAPSGGQVFPFCVQRKLPGILLSHCRDLPAAGRADLTRQAGEMLSRIHTVPTRGAGYIDGQGRGEHPDFATLLGEFLGEAADYAALAQRVGLDPEEMARAFAYLDSAFAAAAPIRTCLIHNDFLPKHILVQDGKISGIIDFGEAASEPPVNELAKWDYLEGVDFPLAWLMEGYGGGPAFTAAFQALFGPLRLMNALCLLRWYGGEGFGAGLEDAKHRFHRLMADIPA